MYFGWIHRNHNEFHMPLAWLALNSAKGLGPVRIKHLLERYGSPEDVFRESPAVLAKLDGFPSSSASLLKKSELFQEAERQVKLAESLGVTILTLANDSYPSLLREIYAPPPVIFVRGELEVFSRHAVAVVGTRTPSEYGKSATAMLTREIAGKGVAVISGLARGIDTVAHRTCLDPAVQDGCTVAVFGCGIDTVYPASNRGLAEEITQRGALVSEFPPGTRPEAFNFPRRNRIISGLSAGVVVVESARKGGALITAHYALQQGREVFAVPGSVFSGKSIGTHELIRSGATAVRSGQEVLDAITLVSAPGVVRSPSPANLPVALEMLNEAERAVLEVLGDAPVRIDALGEITRRDVSQILGVLLNLELKGLVRQLAGQQYVRALN